MAELQGISSLGLRLRTNFTGQKAQQPGPEAKADPSPQNAALPVIGPLNLTHLGIGNASEKKESVAPSDKKEKADDATVAARIKEREKRIGNFVAEYLNENGFGESAAYQTAYSAKNRFKKTEIINALRDRINKKIPQGQDEISSGDNDTISKVLDDHCSALKFRNRRDKWDKSCGVGPIVQLYEPTPRRKLSGDFRYVEGA